MIFVHSGNEYSAILRCGDVIKFEDEREALAVQKEYDGILEVLGKRLPESNNSVTMHLCESGVKSKGDKKKKVRITIDNTSTARDVEVAKRREGVEESPVDSSTPSVTEPKREPSPTNREGKKEKALA